MGKLLKVLTVFILLLSILAFVMGLSNFKKRELLIGRTHALEEKIVQLSVTLEEKEPVFDGVLSHPERDIDEVTARPLDMPNKTDFWGDYNDALEVLSTPTMRLDNESSRLQLRTYYLLDAEGQIVKDIQKRPKTTGAGTMDELLSKVLERASAQFKRLNSTRNQLTKVRQELESVIELFNAEKKERRLNLVKIVQLEAKFGELETEIGRQKSEVARLEREKIELSDTINELRATLAKKDEELVAYDNRVKRLEEEIKKSTIHGGGADKPLAEDTQRTIQLTAGVKGAVVHIDPEWAYVLVKLTPEAADEITAGGVFSPVEMMVHRKTPSGEVIVTRLRITNPPNKENIVIADNMYGWEQVPIEAGDIVIY